MKRVVIRLMMKLLKPFNIKTVYTDNNFAYQNKIYPDILIPGKKNTQKIERNHLTLRTRIKRLARKSICFSKNKDIHQTVIASFINIFFWRRKLPDFNWFATAPIFFMIQSYFMPTRKRLLSLTAKSEAETEKLTIHYCLTVLWQNVNRA